MMKPVEVHATVSDWLKSKARDPRCLGQGVCKVYRWSPRDGIVSCCSAYDKVLPGAWSVHVEEAHRPVIAHVSDLCYHLQRKLGDADPSTIESWLEQDWETLMAVAACLSKLAYQLHDQARCPLCDLVESSISLSNARAHLLRDHVDHCISLGETVVEHCKAAPPQSYAPPTFCCPHSSLGKSAAMAHSACRAKIQSVAKLNPCSTSAMPWHVVPFHLVQHHLAKFVTSLPKTTSPASLPGSTSSPYLPADPSTSSALATPVISNFILQATNSWSIAHDNSDRSAQESTQGTAPAHAAPDRVCGATNRPLLRTPTLDLAQSLRTSSIDSPMTWLRGSMNRHMVHATYDYSDLQLPDNQEVEAWLRRAEASVGCESNITASPPGMTAPPPGMTASPPRMTEDRSSLPFISQRSSLPYALPSFTGGMADGGALPTDDEVEAWLLMTANSRSSASTTGVRRPTAGEAGSQLVPGLLTLHSKEATTPSGTINTNSTRAATSKRGQTLEHLLRSISRGSSADHGSQHGGSNGQTWWSELLTSIPNPAPDAPLITSPRTAPITAPDIPSTDTQPVPISVPISVPYKEYTTTPTMVSTILASAIANTSPGFQITSTPMEPLALANITTHNQHPISPILMDATSEVPEAAQAVQPPLLTEAAQAVQPPLLTEAAQAVQPPLLGPEQVNMTYASTATAPTAAATAVPAASTTTATAPTAATTAVPAASSTTAASTAATTAAYPTATTTTATTTTTAAILCSFPIKPLCSFPINPDTSSTRDALPSTQLASDHSTQDTLSSTQPPMPSTSVPSILSPSADASTDSSQFPEPPIPVYRPSQLHRPSSHWHTTQHTAHTLTTVPATTVSNTSVSNATNIDVNSSMNASPTLTSTASSVPHSVTLGATELACVVTASVPASSGQECGLQQHSSTPAPLPVAAAAMALTSSSVLMAAAAEETNQVAKAVLESSSQVDERWAAAARLLEKRRSQRNSRNSSSQLLGTPLTTALGGQPTSAHMTAPSSVTADTAVDHQEKICQSLGQATTSLGQAAGLQEAVRRTLEVLARHANEPELLAAAAEELAIAAGAAAVVARCSSDPQVAVTTGPATPPVGPATPPIGPAKPPVGPATPPIFTEGNGGVTDLGMSAVLPALTLRTSKQVPLSREAPLSQLHPLSPSTKVQLSVVDPELPATPEGTTGSFIRG